MNKMKEVPFEIELANKITSGAVKGVTKTRDGSPVRILCFSKRKR